MIFNLNRRPKIIETKNTVYRKTSLQDGTLLKDFVITHFFLQLSNKARV